MAVIGSMNRFDRKALNFTIIRQTLYSKKSWEDVDADIAVLMVDRSMPLGKENVKLVKLQNNRTFNRGSLCSVAGWGDSRDNSNPDILKFVKIPLVSRKRCEKSYPYDPPGDLLCAGYYERGGPDTCQGDSGGPLVCGGQLTGIVKGGVGCGLPHYPGTYTDVSYYSSWVERVMVHDWEAYFKHEAPSPFRRKWAPHPRRARKRTRQYLWQEALTLEDKGIRARRK
ncbi:Trypsin eta [Gryllus bimaculatus]|nr:Trypsin eta [Gryllus bimaculatus]